MSKRMTASIVPAWERRFCQAEELGFACRGVGRPVSHREQTQEM
jgi:hypothetical protein